MSRPFATPLALFAAALLLSGCAFMAERTAPAKPAATDRTQAARHLGTYASWPYRAALEARIEQAQANVAVFNAPRTASAGDRVMMAQTRFACMGCHQKSAGVQSSAGGSDFSQGSEAPSASSSAASRATPAM